MNAIPLVWALGFTVLMLRLSAARWMLWNSERLAVVFGRHEASQLASVAHKERETSQDPIFIAMTALCGQLKIRRPVTLLIHPHKNIPVVWGIFHCRLMLPAAARQWSEEQLQSVLMHELAHIKRGDILVQLLTQVACALHWFNPLVWFAAWRLEVERERSCDDLVLASGIRPSAYAVHLLDVVSGLSTARWTQACGLAMARKSSLEGRLTAVLGEDLNRRSVSVTLAGGAMLIAVGIAVPIAMLRAAQPVETNLVANAMNSEPKDDKSKALFESWKTSARTDGKIPGGRIGELATELKTRLNLNPGSQTAVIWEEALKKCDVTRDWSPSEAALLLDEIEVAVPGLAESAMWTNTERMIHFGKALPAELKDAPWGSPEAQGEPLDASSVSLRGLRMAWLLEPKEESYALGGVLKSRVLFHNTGKIPVCFATENWIQSGMHMAKDAAGKEISVWATQRLGERTRMIFCLAPGEYAEVDGHSIGIGSHESATNNRTQQAGAWIEAKPGDLVTFLPGKLHVSFQTWQNNEGRKDSKRVWNETIAARVAQEGPWPMSVADRELLIKRVTVDLGIPLHNEEFRVELLTDNSSDGLFKLTAQLQAASASMHFSGELSSGETTFKVTEARPNVAAVIPPADEPQAIMPNHKDARAVYEAWQRFARANGDIPGALVGELAKAIKVFIGYNPTWETVPKLNAILPRLDATRDWKPAEAVAVLDEVASVQATLLEPAPWKGTRQTIRKGEALPKQYADVSWGEEQPSGLRAAWFLEPSATEHRIGAAIKARLLVQNRGQVPVIIQVPTWHQGWVKATDAKGTEVQVSGIEWTTMALLNTVRLGPSEYIEINTPGVGIGPRAGMGPWAGPRVGSNVLAKPGDELTLTYSPVPLDGSEVGISQEDPHVSGAGWWLAHIKARLDRELPLPADAAERTRMLDRAVRELFATAPTAEETEAFIADKSPEAIDALAKRLAARTDAVSFSGKLPTAPVKFRVLDAVASADKQPRVVLGPGEYPLPCPTAERGDATLKIVGKPIGDRRTNEAQILFEAIEATGVRPPDPYKLDVPEGWGTWAIVCRPSDGYFYLLHKGTVRKVDYSKPRSVTDTLANDLPAEFRDEVKRQLDIHGISAERQAEIFGKPVSPAASLRSEVQDKPKPSARLQPATEQKLKWGEPVNGLRMALAWPPVLGEPVLGDKPEFYLVVQNVSDKALRLTSNDTAPNPRSLSLYDATIVSRVVDDVTIPGDWLLQPREAAFVRLFHAEQKFDDGRTTSIAEENVVSTLGQYSVTAQMTIETAPAGAWTGKLVTGATRGSADVLEAGKPIELRSAPPMSWGAPKDGLRGAVRIIGELRTSKEAKAELWVHNSSSETVKFSWTHHADVGLAIVPTDGSGSGREAHMTRGKTEFKLQSLALPAGQAVKLKEFTIRLGSPPTDGPVGIVSLELRPGDWTLQAKWTDTLHMIEAAPEWRGELKTGEIKLKVTPEGATVVETPTKNAQSLKPAAPATPALNRQGVKLFPAIEQKLKWGEPVNGLRAALVMAPVPDEPDAEDKNDIFLVVQNVTKAEVWLHASDAGPNPRQLIWRDKGALETVNEVANPIAADVRLQPGEVAFFRMTHPPGKRNPGGQSTGSLIEESIRTDPTFSLEGSMKISTAPNGAWSGTLVTGRTQGGTAIPAL